MSCGCVDNKNLNKDKLSLESMQTLSIDEIINLYRQGYILEESENFTDIRSLALSSPQIQYATAASGVPSAGKIRITWIWSNTGGYGYGQFKFYSAGTLIGTMPSCCYDTGPSQLYRLSTFDITSGVSVLDIVTYKCNSDTQQSCPTGSDPSCTGTCSAVVEASRLSNTDALPYGTTAPSAPSTLTITPGNGSLTLTWSTVTNTSILGYHIVIKRSGTTVIDGYWSQNVGPVTITGLTNGISHDVLVSAVSASNIEGTAKTGSGTPSLPTPVLTTITTTPPTAAINVGGTQQFTATCKDQYNATIQCPTLAWASSDPSKATINTTSGLATGAGAGSSDITASGGGKISSPASVLTVNPLTCTAITNVSATPNPVTQGQTVTLTATTTPASAGFSVIFKDGATTLSTQTTNSSGVATYPWSTTGQSTGAHSITASVVGQCTSPSATIVTINPTQQNCASITLSANPTSVTVGQTIILTATTAPASAGFNVIFKDGSTTLQTVATNSSGIATYSWNTTGQPTGAHPLTASVVSQCTSSITTVTINPVGQQCTSITTPTATPTTIVANNPVTLIAIVSPTGTYTVEFYNANSPTQVFASKTETSPTTVYSVTWTPTIAGTYYIKARVGTQCISPDSISVTVTTPPVSEAGGMGIVIGVIGVAILGIMMMQKPKVP